MMETREEKIFGDIPIKTEAKWKFWLVKIFGKIVYKESGLTFKEWRGNLWMFGNVTPDDPPTVRRDKGER